MQNKEIRILLVEDDEVDKMAFKRYVVQKSLPYSYTIASSVEEVFTLYQSNKYDIAIVDYMLGDGNAFDILQKIHNLPAIIITSFGNEEIAVKAMKAGAYDYIIKDTGGNYLTTLPITIEKVLKHRADELELEQYHQDLEEMVKIKTKELTSEINEHKRAQIALRRSEEKYRYLIETMNEGVVIRNSDGVITFANTSLCNLLGYDESELLNRTLSDFFPENAKLKQNSDNRYEPQIHVTRFEIELQHKQGDVANVIISTRYFTESDEFEGSFSVITDITEQKLIANKIQEAREKAEQSDRLKTAFLTNMSHELRTPMNAIIGFASLLDDNELIPVKRNSYIQQINSNCATLLQLINDIIDISKIEAGEISINKSACYINKILTELFVLFNEQKVTEKKFDVNFLMHRPNKLPNYAITTDPLRFKQIMTNLLSNALKYTETGFIELGYILPKAGDEGSNPMIVFYVKDTGIGISVENLISVFERFRKIEDSKTKLYRGAGLGLTISKRLVELLGGNIWVESELHKGSTFFFSIPFIQIAMQAAPVEPINKPLLPLYQWENKVILIAEDEDDNFRLIEAIFLKTKAQIIWAKNGQQAVQICKSNNNIDMVLMDIKMPIMNGMEATTLIKQMNKNLPVVAITAFAMSGERDEILFSGCDEYLTKPVDAQSLLSTVDTLFKQSVKREH